MFSAPLTFGERATHAAANTVPFGFTVLGSNALARWSPHAVAVAMLAVTAGLCLGGLSLITVDLIEIGNPRIRGLTLLGALAYLSALWACPDPVLAGGASLAFACWLAYMIAESAAQAIRVRAYFARTRHAPILAQTAQTSIDAACFTGASLLLPVPGSGPAVDPPVGHPGRPRPARGIAGAAPARANPSSTDDRTVGAASVCVPHSQPAPAVRPLMF